MIKIYGVGVSDGDDSFNKGTIVMVFGHVWFLSQFIGLEPMLYGNVNVDGFDAFNYGFLFGFQIYFKKQKE